MYKTRIRTEGGGWESGRRMGIRTEGGAASLGKDEFFFLLATGSRFLQIVLSRSTDCASGSAHVTLLLVEKGTTSNVQSELRRTSVRRTEDRGRRTEDGTGRGRDGATTRTGIEGVRTCSELDGTGGLGRRHGGERVLDRRSAPNVVVLESCVVQTLEWIPPPGSCIGNPGRCIRNPGRCIRNPGRCPGLVCFALSGRKFTSTKPQHTGRLYACPLRVIGSRSFLTNSGIRAM
jgi:hypothetical protein